MKLIVLTTVVSFAVITVNCRDLADGPEDPAFTFEPENLPTGRMEGGFPTGDPGPEQDQGGFEVADSLEAGLQLKFKTDEEDGDLVVDPAERDLDTYEEDIDLETDSELRAMPVNGANSELYRKKNNNKMMNKLISKLTIANAKMINFMTASITNLTIANAEMKSELQFIKGNMTNALDTVRKHQESSTTNLTIANAEMKSELQYIKGNMTNALTKQDKKLDSVTKHQGCPEGLFYYAPTAQCFLLLNDTGRSWYSADSACRAKGLVLAQPNDPAGLRNYMLAKFGDFGNWPWLGARGTGSYVRYQRSKYYIGSSNPLWRVRSGRTSTSYCLLLTTSASYMKSYGIQVYYMYGCSTKSQWAICELVRE